MPNFEPHSDPYNSKQEGIRTRPHTGLSGLHSDRARCLPQGRRFRGRKLYLPLAIFSPLLATGPNFDPLSDPLKPKATRVYPVGPNQASQAYMLTGPVASHKVEYSEAASPNFLTHILHLLFQAPHTDSPNFLTRIRNILLLLLLYC